MKINILYISIFAITSLLLFSCSDDEDVMGMVGEETDLETEEIQSDFEVTDWTEETHSKSADPNFAEVFQDDAVKRLDFVISEDNWNLMLENMTDLYGAFGNGRRAEFADENPVFVPGSVFYNGTEWYKVGLRFKGNSSLASTWASGILKLSFKMDFDEYEDEFPQIDNQRFYGFKKLSLKNNFNDLSMLREKVAGDVFRNAGLVAPHTAFYTLYVDYGEGPQYFGLYTLVEEVDDTVIDTQFAADDGNLYKPDGDAATFAEGTYNEDEYVKKTNEDDGDFSDVQKLLSVLHDDTRITDVESWRSELEEVFDTDVFLKYLATNTTIQNWDTYGRMTHNYFLYNDPDTDKLTWIPWDNNEALQEGKQGGSLALDFSDLQSSTWPLIAYLYQDEVYNSQYDNYLQEVINGPFNVSTIQAQYNSYAAIVEDHASSEINGYSFLNNTADFQNDVNNLIQHVEERASAVRGYLNK